MHTCFQRYWDVRQDGGMRTDVRFCIDLCVEVTDDLSRAALIEDGGESLDGVAESPQETRKCRRYEDSISHCTLL